MKVTWIITDTYSTTTSCSNLLCTILYSIISTPKNSYQFFYMQESDALSNRFIQFNVLPDDESVRPETCTNYWFL